MTSCDTYSLYLYEAICNWSVPRAEYNCKIFFQFCLGQSRMATAPGHGLIFTKTNAERYCQMYAWAAWHGRFLHVEVLVY